MTSGKDRDERKLTRAFRMKARAQRMGTSPRQQKRRRRLEQLADRILEVRSIKFNHLRSQNLWPRP